CISRTLRLNTHGLPAPCFGAIFRGGNMIHMAQLETFSTADQPQYRRLEYWNDLAGRALTPLVTDPVDRRAFVGRLTSAQIGDIRLAEVHSEPARVRHSRQHVARAQEALFILCLQLDGVSFIRQQGREAVLSYGDFNLLDSLR